MTEYILKRSCRKTMSLRILEDGSLEVRAPMTVSAAAIEQFVHAHADWVENRRKRMQHVPKRTIGEGASWPLRGVEYPLRFDETRPYGYFDDAFVLPVNFDAREQLILLYRILALRILEPRVRELARLFDITVREVKINDAKGRYGSCSSAGNINLAWRLVMWPDEVIDYVLTHELAHRLQMNHSTAFWREVALRCPDYRKHDAFLRKKRFHFSFPA